MSHSWLCPPDTYSLFLLVLYIILMDKKIVLYQVLQVTGTQMLLSSSTAKMQTNLWHAYRKTAEKYYNNAFEFIVCQAYILRLEKEESSFEVQSWREKTWETPIIQQRQWVLRAGHSRYRTDQSSHSVIRKHSLECKVMSSRHLAKQSQH